MRLPIRGFGVLLLALVLLASPARADWVTTSNTNDFGDVVQFSYDPIAALTHSFTDGLGMVVSGGLDQVRAQIITTTQPFEQNPPDTTNAFSNFSFSPVVPGNPFSWFEVGQSTQVAMANTLGLLNTPQVFFDLNFADSPNADISLNHGNFVVRLQAFRDGNLVLNQIGEFFYGTNSGGQLNPFDPMYGLGITGSTGFTGTWAWRTNTDTTPIPPVPEPISMIMLGCLGTGMLVARKIKRKS